MIRILTQADKEMILQYLKRNEIETSFLFANVIEFGVDNDPKIRRCADYYGFFEGEALKGILPFYNLGSCIPHFETIDAVPAFIELMKERDFEFLLGMDRVTRPLYEGTKAYKEVLTYDESSYFTNKNLKPFILEGVSFIIAKGIVNDNIVDFVMESRIKGFNQTVVREDVKKSLLQRGEEEEYIFLEKDNRIIAQACVQTYTDKINQIGSVYTTESERGKGYCKAIVSELCKIIIGRGKLPTLSVKKKNLPAVKAYNALGFEHYDDYLIVKYKYEKP